MRIRTPFALSFTALCLLAAYLGLSAVVIPINGGVVHFVVFFTLTTCFYWILEASRRRVFNLTLLTCPISLSIGSEFLQSFVTTQKFDILSLVMNVLGSAIALLLCGWYHKRMLERKRLAKKYLPVASAEEDGDGEVAEMVDLEGGGAGAGEEGNGEGGHEAVK